MPGRRVMTGRRGVLLAAAMSLATAGVERADETDELIGALKPSPPDDAVWAA